MGRARAFTAKVVMLRGKPTGQVGPSVLRPPLRANSCARLEGNSRSGALRLPRASPWLKSTVKLIQRFDPTDLAEFLLASLEGRNSSYEGRTRPCRARSS